MRFFAVSFLFLAGIVNYLDRTSFSIANTSIRADLGLSGTRIGALLSAFSLAYGIAQLPIGLMLDRLGSRVILAAGMFVWSLAQMATGLVSSFGGFMATRITLGAGEAPIMPCGVKVMNDWFGVRDRGLPTGLLTASNTLGVTLAPPVLTVIMLTGSGNDADIDTAYDLGIDAYLIKPAGVRGLPDVVRELHLPYELILERGLPDA